MSTFQSYLSEANKEPRKLTQVNLERIALAAFGQLINNEISNDSVDLSMLKPVLSKLSNVKLSKIIMQAAERVQLRLVPTDGTDANGFINAGPGGEDCLMFKFWLNDYSDYEDEVDYDLVLTLKSFKLSIK